MENREELDAIVTIVKNIIPLREAYLFGSHAYGKPTSDSDYDIYFVADEIIGTKYNALVEIYDAINEIRKRPIDVLLNTKEYFDYRKHNKSTIEHKVANEGVNLYEQRNV